MVSGKKRYSITLGKNAVKQMTSNGAWKRARWAQTRYPRSSVRMVRRLTSRTSSLSMTEERERGTYAAPLGGLIMRLFLGGYKNRKYHVTSPFLLPDLAFKAR